MHFEVNKNLLVIKDSSISIILLIITLSWTVVGLINWINDLSKIAIAYAKQNFAWSNENELETSNKLRDKDNHFILKHKIK